RVLVERERADRGHRQRRRTRAHLGAVAADRDAVPCANLGLPERLGGARSTRSERRGQRDEGKTDPHAAVQGKRRAGAMSSDRAQLSPRGSVTASLVSPFLAILTRIDSRRFWGA